MKIKFRDIKLSSLNTQRLQLINSIIEDYQRQGYTLTLRQLYYQLVSRDIIANKIDEYQKLSTLLKEGRMGGIVDWDAIEDRLRKPDISFYVDSPKDAMDIIIDQFALNRQNGQDKYLEVWVEKDALSGVLKRVTHQYHVPIMVNQGYSSASAMFDSYNRFKKALHNDQRVVVIYLGDFDPSGLDMIRDIKARITEFFLACIDTRTYFHSLINHLNEVNNQYRDKAHEYCEVNWEVVGQIQDEHQYFDIMYMLWINDQFEVRPIALTESQIQNYNPPPNPAKVTDPRAKEYIAKYGPTSWEVDALKPEVLHKLLDDTIVNYMDLSKFDDIIKQEQVDRQKLITLKNSL